MDEIFLSVSEFAKLANISRQSIYKSCNSNHSKLSPYVRNTPEGKKISSKALVFYSQPEDNSCKPSVNPLTTKNQLPVNQESTDCKAEVNQEAVNVDTHLSTSQDNQAQAVVLATLTAQLQEKDKQIAEKDKQIERLQQAGAEKDKFIQEQSKQLALLLAQSQELQRNNQILLGAMHGAAQQAENTPPTNYDLNAEPQTPQEAQEPKKEHKGFFKWLFG